MDAIATHVAKEGRLNKGRQTFAVPVRSLALSIASEPDGSGPRPIAAMPPLLRDAVCEGHELLSPGL